MILLLHKLRLALITSLLVAGTQLDVRAQVETRTIVASEAQNGGAVVIGLEDRLEVRLSAQLGTGFSWMLESSEVAPLRLSDQRIETRTDAAPGSPEVQIFTFTALSPGSTALRFAYRRPWVPQEAPARSFSLAVTAR